MTKGLTLGELCPDLNKKGQAVVAAARKEFLEQHPITGDLPLHGRSSAGIIAGRLSTLVTSGEQPKKNGQRVFPIFKGKAELVKKPLKTKHGMTVGRVEEGNEVTEAPVKATQPVRFPAKLT